VVTPALAPGWAFFLDVDGTLLEIAPRPEAVQAHEDDRRLLGALHEAAGGAVALISGRALAGIDALFSPIRLPAAGLHGIERRDAAGRIHRHAFPGEALRRAAARLDDFASRHPGLVFEDKGASLALHYRLAPHLAAQAGEAVDAAAAELGESVEIQRGKMVLEVKPSGRNKGSALEEFMAEVPFAGRTPVFIGDDLTDEHAFAVVNRLGGHSIKVGEGATLAKWRLEGVRALHVWLAAWIDEARRCSSA
jgi:trehalose 6-phosphate phosphatase